MLDTVIDAAKELARLPLVEAAGPAAEGGHAPALRGLGLADQLALLAPRPLRDAAPPQAEPGAPVPGAPPDLGMTPVPALGGLPAPEGAEAAADAARPTLRWGSRGEDVVRLQSLLNHTDEVTTPLVVDGLFGPQTHKAVVEFQRAHPPLGVDGVVGPQTWGVLGVTPLEPQDPKSLATKLFKRGAGAYERGEYAHAHDLFQSADEHFHAVEFHFNRGQCLRRLGARRPEAIALYERYLAEGGGARNADAQAALVELRGPGRSGVEEVDLANAKTLFQQGAALYGAGDYAHAYDAFCKADEAKHAVELIFNQAQCLRRLGGRREEAIALYEAYLAEGGGGREADARAALAELRTPAATGVEVVDKAAAKALFKKGADAYAAGDFGHAYDEFTRTDELWHDAALTFNRAQSLRRLGARREEAMQLYAQYLAEGTGDRNAEAAFYLRELQTQGALDVERRV